MRDLIVILVLYVVVLFAFGWCGGHPRGRQVDRGLGPPQHEAGGTQRSPLS